MNDMAYTVDRLALRWCCSPDVIYDLLRKQKLKGFKLGSSWRISAANVELFENNDEKKEETKIDQATEAGNPGKRRRKSV